MAPPPRLARLPCRRLPGGLRLYEAEGLRARALGLAGLAELPAEAALLIPRCRSVHTFGMRFPLDLVFLADDGTPFDVTERVRPGRFAGRRGARAVLETCAGASARFVAALAHPGDRGPAGA